MAAAEGVMLFPALLSNCVLLACWLPRLSLDVTAWLPTQARHGVLLCTNFDAAVCRHFEDDPNMSFALLEEDQVTRRPVRLIVSLSILRSEYAQP